MISTARAARRLLIKLDKYQTPKNKFGNKRPGIPCGKSYISWRKKCSEGRTAVAQQRLKGTDEGKAYAARVRKSKELGPLVGKKEPPKKEPPKKEPPKKVRKMADLNQGDMFYSGVHFRGGPTPGNFWISKKGERGFYAKKTTTTGRVAKTAKEVWFSYRQVERLEGEGLFETEPRELSRKESGPGRKYIGQSDVDTGKATRVGPSISARNVVTVDKRFGANAVNMALDAIDTPGAKERVAALREISEAQGIQTVFNSSRSAKGKADALSEGLDVPGRQYLAWKKESEAINAGDYSESSKKRAQQRLKKVQHQITGNHSNAAGYTSRSWRHVVVSAERHGKYDEFKVDAEKLRESTAETFKNFAEGKPAFSVSGSTKGPEGDLKTYIHEIGHQVRWVSLNGGKAPSLADVGLAGYREWEATQPVVPDAPPLHAGLTRYSRTNQDEQFAEHFALWVLDAPGLKKASPEMHDFIEKSVESAKRRGRRIDAMSRTDAVDDDPNSYNPAETELGRKAFAATLGDLDSQTYQKIKAISALASTPEEVEETGAAMEAFLVSGGESA